MIYKIQSKTYKMTSMDLHVTFDFAIFKLETDKSIKTQKTLKHWPIPKTYLKVKTSWFA